MNKAAFLDRDGVINQKARGGGYITHWEQLRILPGVVEAIALLNQAGVRVIVASNQRCVAKGLLTILDLEVLHRRMCEAVASHGARIDGIYYCPHDTQPPCRCRKPQPGMLFDAARDHDIDLSASWMIGDSPSDVEAGRNAGCKTALLAARDDIVKTNADIIAPSLIEATRQILRLEQDITNRKPGLPAHTRF